MIEYDGFKRITSTKIHVAVEQNGLPYRRAFDRRFRVIPVKDIMIDTMGRRFVSEEGLADSMHHCCRIDIRSASFGVVSINIIQR